MEIKDQIILQVLSTVPREPEETPTDYLLRLKELYFTLASAYEKPQITPTDASIVTAGTVTADHVRY